MNELNDEFSSKGLSIIGVTSEGESQTEPWVESKGARYAYAYDKGGKLSKALGVSGIPNAVLVDPTGKILWQGHPSSLTADLVEKAIVGAIKTPIYEWGGSAKAIKKSFLKGDFAKAIAAADKLGEKETLGTEIATMLRGMVADRVKGYETDLERGDIYKAFEGAKSLAKGIKGLPEEAALEALLTKISKDKDLKSALKTQEKLAEILTMEMRKKKQCDEVLGKLEKLLKGNAGTHTGDLIDAAIKDVRKARSKLKR